MKWFKIKYPLNSTPYLKSLLTLNSPPHPLLIPKYQTKNQLVVLLLNITSIKLFEMKINE